MACRGLSVPVRQITGQRAYAHAWLLGGLALAAVSCGARGARASGETVMFAGTCGTGLTASASLSLNRYPVVGPRAAKRVMACAPTGFDSAGRCQLVEVYRFDIMCNGQRRKWANVARGLARQLQPEPPSRNTGARREFQLQRLTPDGFALTVRQPAGYAPLDEIGARLEPAVLTAPTRALPLHALVTTAPLPDITPAAYSPDDDQSAFAPPTEGDQASAQLSQEPPASSVSLTVAAAIAAAIAALVVARLYPRQARAVGQKSAEQLSRAARQLQRIQSTHQPVVLRHLSRLRWRVSRLATPGQSRDINTMNAVASVGALLADTEQRLKELRTAGPLTDVLRQELGQLRQRLDTLKAATIEGEEQAARAAPSFRNLLRDVERVRRIADSAAVSLGGPRNPTRVPETKSEAYAALGLNPDVAEPTLKKVADGLRMSWHPDLARDDADRREREDRIKAINIALDLIHEKRIVA